MKQKRIAFLIGSGVSIPAKLPSTGDITKILHTGRGISYDSGSKVFHWVDCPDSTSSDIVPLRDLFNRVKVESDLYYHRKPERRTNYEDVYDLIVQMRDSLSGDYDNPSIAPLIERIFGRKSNNTSNLGELLETSANYVQDVVCDILMQPSSHFDHLKVIGEVCAQASQKKNLPVDIFTLNHDTLQENFFQKIGEQVQFTDGFSEDKDHIQFWNKQNFNYKNIHVRLFKLHGSINWYRVDETVQVDKDKRRQLSSRIARLLQRPNSSQMTRGQRQFNLEDRGCPKILIGSFNKMFDYLNANEIFTDLYYCLDSFLPKAKRLVICGYGFGDKAINTQIIRRVNSAKKSGEHKILVIDPGYDRFQYTARPAISNKLPDWEKDGIVIIPRDNEKKPIGMENLTLDMVSECISN